MANIISLCSRLQGEIKKNGIYNTITKVLERKEKDRRWKDYESIRLAARPSGEELRKQCRRVFVPEMMFSIVVPVYRTPELFLRQMIESVLGQTFSCVELCIADGSGDDESTERIIREYQEKDPRIKYQKLRENKGISENTNAALALASGDYVGLLDHDDLLEPDALYEVRRAIAMTEHADVIYTDEDKVSTDLTRYFDPHIKPDFNRDLLRSNNYICHFCVIRRELLTEIGGFRGDYDGAQDYDLVLRLSERAEQIVHIPKVLYHWRTHEASTAANPFSKLYAYESGKRALEDHLSRCALKGRVSHTRFFGFYRTDYEIPDSEKVTVVFLSCQGRNHKKILKKFFGEIDRQTTGNVIYYDNGFNKFVTFSRKFIKNMDSDILVFADSRLEKISENGVEQLAAHVARKGTGVSGGVIYDGLGHLLYGRKETDADAGLPKDADAGLPKGFTGDFHKAVLQQETAGVTSRFFAVRKEFLSGFEPGESCAEEEAVQKLVQSVQEKGSAAVYVPQACAVLKIRT